MSTTYPVTLLFSDGVAHRMDLPQGANLVEAVAEQGLNLLTDCSNGQCGTCVGQLCSGAIELGDYDDAVLPDEDREDGSVLPCVAIVSGPCVLELPYDYSEACMEEPEPFMGRITALEQVALETMRLDVEIEQPLWFEPGQYVHLRPLGGAEWRSYSMANRSGSKRLTFYIRLVEGGNFSSWLQGSAQVGAELELSVPRGSFFLRDEDRPRLFVAGGTGLAPFLSMLQVIEEQGSSLPTTLVVGVRTADHYFAQQAIEACRERLPQLSVYFASEQGGLEGCHQGYPTDLIETLDLDPRTRAYLCGPPPMVEAGRNACVAKGLARRDVLCERFA